MADLNNLGAAPNPWDVDFDTLPMGFGASFVEPPQPGTYLFRLPSRLQIEKSFEEVDHSEQGKRLRCSFRDDTALYNVTLKEQYQTSLSNVGRLITPKGGTRQPFVVSDLASLLKAVGIKPTNQTLQGWKEAMLDAAEAEFLADHVLTANCNKSRDVYKYDENVGKSILHAGLKGCGAKYRLQSWDGGGDVNKAVAAIPQDSDGKYLLRFTCYRCSAEIRAWGQLQGFRPTK